MLYEIDGVRYSVDSAVNQRILQELVNRIVFCNMTVEVEYMLKRMGDLDCPIEEESIHNEFVQNCDECSCTVVKSDDEYKCTGCGKIFSESDYYDLESYPNEIYEWWAVDPYFGDKLEAYGETIIEAYGKSYWGRTCTGQMISCDSIIAQLAIDMKILDGMEYDWSDKRK